jgi:O-antigen ligase
MTIIKRKILPLLVIITIAFTLLNSNAFGGSTLVSLFLFCILAGIIGSLVFGKKLFQSRKIKYEAPTYIWVFLILGLYVFFHGLLNNHIGLTHFYWIACSIFIFSIHLWVSSSSDNESKVLFVKSIMFIHWGIIVLAFLETTVVFLQCLFIIPSPNRDFLCTGTWINPNVTAMFLSMTLFSILLVLRKPNKKFTKRSLQAILISTLLAIVLLKCRSAYIAASIMVLVEYWQGVRQLAKSYFKFNVRGFIVVLVGYVIVQALISTFSHKSGSTINRITIWKNSIDLIFQKPVFGNGFGQFEKEYNLFISQIPDKSNDHINMPYNDFLELGVEGGFIAVLLWLLFLIALFKHANKRIVKSQGFLPLIVSFIIIQLTNFGIQAIPAMVLFLLYIALQNFPLVGNSISNHEISTAIKLPDNPAYLKRFTCLFAFSVSLIFTVTAFNLMGAFYNNWMIPKAAQNQAALNNYRNLNNTLNGYPLYHENFGDALMNARQVPEALNQYKMALQNTSSPDALSKVGFCYQLLKQYDSSEHYFSIVQNMQPYKFYPKLTLLKLYLQKGDTLMVRYKATEIKTMTVKIKSQRVEEITKYADSLLSVLNNDSFKFTIQPSKKY